MFTPNKSENDFSLRAGSIPASTSSPRAPWLRSDLCFPHTHRNTPDTHSLRLPLPSLKDVLSWPYPKWKCWLPSRVTPSMDCSLPGSSVHGILQARTLEWVTVSFYRGSSRCRDWTQVICIAGRFFTVWATREARLWTCKEGCPRRMICKRSGSRAASLNLWFHSENKGASHGYFLVKTY